MSVAIVPGNEPRGVPVPYTEYQRVSRELDQWKRTATEAQQKLSAVTAAIQNASLSWKERGTRVSVVLALEAQRPRENPRAQFHVDLGDLAKRAGLIPPTPDGDEEARSKAWKSGRKLAGQVVKELAEHGVIEGRFVDIDRDQFGEATTSSVVLQIERPHIEVVRAVSQMGGTRKLLKPRGIHTKIEPRCPECHSMDTDLRCHACGTITPTREILDAMDRADATGFQRLETLSTTYREHSDKEETITGFQSLETGATVEPEAPEEPQEPEVLPKPTYHPPDPAGIPTRLMGRQQWVSWRAEQRDGQWTKVPISPATGQRADPKDPETWGTCAQALKRYRDDGLEGVGFVFTADDPFLGVDLDEMNESARAIVADLASYTEESPSGRGVHVIIEASKPGPRCRAGTVEMYDKGRFFAITGRRLEGSLASIEPRQGQIDGLYAGLFPDPPPRPSAQRSAPVQDDAQLVDRAMRARNGAAFGRLWRGDLGHVGGDESLGDWKLCLYLKYWTDGDAACMDRLFRQSGLMREKWDRPDGTHGTYGERTIHRVLGDA
jgi:hypothetical protein